MGSRRPDEETGGLRHHHINGLGLPFALWFGIVLTHSRLGTLRFRRPVRGPTTTWEARSRIWRCRLHVAFQVLSIISRFMEVGDDRLSAED